MLFVHGGPVGGATYRTLLPYLTEHVTCHLVDLPGAGSSTFTAESPLSLELHIEAVRAVVHQLRLDSVAVVGHDSGGMIARHALAGDERIRVRGMIDTDQPRGTSWRFNLFLNSQHFPASGRRWVGWRARQRYVAELGALHAKIDEPIQMVWGAGQIIPFELANELFAPPILPSSSVEARSYRA